MVDPETPTMKHSIYISQIHKNKWNSQKYRDAIFEDFKSLQDVRVTWVFQFYLNTKYLIFCMERIRGNHQHKRKKKEKMIYNQHYAERKQNYKSQPTCMKIFKVYADAYLSAYHQNVQ